MLSLALVVASVSALAPSRRDMMVKFASVATVGAVSAPAFATYTGKPVESVPPADAKAKWNTLYPEKKLSLEKKSPVDRLDLAPPTYETYTKTYPGLTTAFGNPPK